MKVSPYPSTKRDVFWDTRPGGVMVSDAFGQDCNKFFNHMKIDATGQLNS
ncbi:MAG: hypothetical protein HOP04_07105 [Methylophilaceae bacterium]|nr:hypothetical protein [Methylophilaceae bacterium]